MRQQFGIWIMCIHPGNRTIGSTARPGGAESERMTMTTQKRVNPVALLRGDDLKAFAWLKQGATVAKRKAILHREEDKRRLLAELVALEVTRK